MTQTSHKRIYLLLAWLIALVSMLGTLYASEIQGLLVCHLCWYQRIALYPLTIILFIALFRDDLSIGIYTIPLAFIGAVFAGYQYLQQMIPSFAPINVCGAGPNCSDIHFKWLGFITLPFLSLLACLMIVILLLMAYRRSAQ